jgi:hypothetical protein
VFEGGKMVEDSSNLVEGVGGVLWPDEELFVGKLLEKDFPCGTFERET